MQNAVRENSSYRKILFSDLKDLSFTIINIPDKHPDAVKVHTSHSQIKKIGHICVVDVTSGSISHHCKENYW